jgi:hypothetical protein
MKLAGIFSETRGRVFFRVDRDGHQVHFVARGSEFVFELGECLAHERTYGAAGGEDENEDDRVPVVHFIG